MIDRVIGLLGLALAFIFYVVPVDRLPPAMRKAGIIFGILLIGISIGVMWANSSNDAIKPRAIKTTLRLDFYGDVRLPTESYAENISSWYCVWSPSATVSSFDKGGKEIERHIFPKYWSIFVLFAKPITYRQLVISFSSQGFPQYEVKQSDARHAIITVSGDIPAGSLELNAK